MGRTSVSARPVLSNLPAGCSRGVLAVSKPSEGSLLHETLLSCLAWRLAEAVSCWSQKESWELLLSGLLPVTPQTPHQLPVTRER